MTDSRARGASRGQRAKDIKSVQGLQAIRKTPGMYIGTTDSDGLWTIVREPLDNVIDEALVGRAKTCGLVALKDGSYVVYDDGQGIPVDEITIRDGVSGKAHRVSAFRAAVGVVHSGGKSQQSKAYKNSRGVHGVGIKATNAMSSKFQAWTCRNGKWWTTTYQSGVLKTDVTQSKAPNIKGAGPFKRGTVVQFVPDTSVFTERKLSLSPTHVDNWAVLSSTFTPGLTIHVDIPKLKKTYASDAGTSKLLKRMTKGHNSLGSFSYSSPLVDVAFAFTDADKIGIEFYTNGLLNSDGGNHQDSTYEALHRAIETYAKRGQSFTRAELKDGLIGVVNVKLAAPKFHSQTKSKLTDERAQKPLKDELQSALEKFFRKNKAIAIKVLERASKLNALKAKFRFSKRALTEINKRARSGFPPKFSPALKVKPEDRELFLVEGQSAGGMALRGALQNQEILQLKGKILNTMRASVEDAFSSEAILDIFVCIGIKPNVDKPEEHLRVGRVCLLADPDHDGGHINCLLLSLLYKYAPMLFDSGKVYIVLAPEFMTTSKKGEHQFYETLAEAQKKCPKGQDIQHIKGYGEMEADALHHIAFNPKTRRMVRVAPIENSGEEFELLMAEDTEYRKKLLELI
jgi:DNA gyrase/topoisomerase IV subunit B